MTVLDAKVWQAWLLELNGLAGTFYLSDTIAGPGSGTVAGTPLVNGADQASESLATDGWSGGDNVKAGDWISIADQLYTILDDASESGGAMTLTIWPEARNPMDNAAISYGTSARGVFRLSEWPTFAWGIDRLQAPLTLIALEHEAGAGLLTEAGGSIVTEGGISITSEADA